MKGDKNMREKTFEIQGKKVTINSKELNTIFCYCFRESIIDKIKSINEEMFENSKEIDENIIENIADHMEEKLEFVEVDNWIEEDLTGYYEEMEENVNEKRV